MNEKYLYEQPKLEDIEEIIITKPQYCIQTGNGEIYLPDKFLVKLRMNSDEDILLTRSENQVKGYLSQIWW